MHAARGPRRTRAWLAVVVVLLAGACSEGEGTFDATTPLEQVRTMLRQRAKLLVTKDVEGYLRPLSPEARAAEEPLARGAASVPLSFANVTFTPDRVPRPGDTSFLDVPVEVVYRYEGLPEDNRFRFTLRYDVEKRGPSWLVTRSAPEADVPLPLWARSPVQVERSEHFLALFRPGIANAAQALQQAEQARRQLAEKLRFGESDSTHLVLLARDHAEYQEILGQEVAEESVAVAQATFLPFTVPESRRMTVNLGFFVDRGQARLEGHSGALTGVSVFQHELAHLALARIDDPVTPSWVNEGAAMYLASERRVNDWEEGLAEGWFDDLSFATFGEESLDSFQAYAYANAGVLYLIEELGTERFWEFYVRFRPSLGSAPPDGDLSDAILRQVYDFGAVELDRRTRAYMADAVAAA